MFRALVIKELREIWWLGLLPLGFMLYAISGEASQGHWLSLTPQNPEAWQKMPFADSVFARHTVQWGCILAGAMGLWQTFRESQSRTWHFLLHRPVSRPVILNAKILSALLVYSLVIVLPVLSLVVWAATPGTHSSPFHWSVTLPTWYAASAGTALYLAGLFAGLRRGSMLGTRWWPLVGATVVLVLGMWAIPRQFSFLFWGSLLLWDVLMAAAIYAELKSADFN